MSEVLYEIKIDPASKPAIALLRKLEGRNLSKLSTEQKVVAVVNKLAEIALHAYQSYVPIDTGYLRDEQLYLSKKASVDNPIRQVLVRSTMHTSSRGHSELAPVIADFLDVGKNKYGTPLYRTHPSDAIFPFTSIPGGKGVKSPTRHWKTKASVAFEVEKDNYLNYAFSLSRDIK